MAFRDIKGQQSVIEFFRSSFNRERLAHAYIFSGPEGLGKTLLAHNLAKFLNCQEPFKEGELFTDCCDRCIACRKIDNRNHPDVHWIEPSRRAEKISIDEIRLVQKEISLKPYEGKFKIFIIQEAQEMTPEAANSLLKTLEEPPSASLLLLISKNISGLLPTVLSRCQIIKFYPLDHERLTQILKKDYAVDANYAHFLAVASEGRIGRAIDLKDEDILNEKNRIIDGVCQVGKQPSFNLFNFKDRKKLIIQIKYLLDWFRDILIFKVGLPSSSIINTDRIEGIKSYTNLYKPSELEQIIAKINQAHRLIEQNVNPKIALEVMLMEMTKCKK